MFHVRGGRYNQSRCTMAFTSIHTAEERFATKHVADGECWRWTGYIDRTGTGRFWFNGWMDMAHRVSYRLFVGPIPEGILVTRTCLNGWCVNPSHLALATKRRPRPRSERPWKNVYNTPEWKAARAAALLRDGHRCTVSRFFTGSCTRTLHVHHLIALEDGGEPFDLNNLGTSCSRHHPMWEALRRRVAADLAEQSARRTRCRHQHRSAEARRICERRMARERGQLVA